MLPRTRLLYVLAAGAALASALALGMSFTLYRSVSEDASRINKAGLVRGYIQRAAKWGLENRDLGALILDVEATLAEAEESIRQDARAMPILGETVREWQELKALLLEGEKPGRREEIFERSERLWFLTVNLVWTVQLSSETRAGRGRYLIYGLFGLLALAAAVLFVVRSYVAGRLESASIRDALSGLFNRRYFELQLAQEALRAERYAAPFTLLVLDLDHFKEVNDRFGHAEGDRVLRAAAEASSSCLRKSDLLFRLGGDEFAVILPATGLDEAREAAEKLRAAVASLGAAGRGVTVSIGMATHEPGLEGALLLARADQALYRAKAEGRNRVLSWKPSA